MERSNKKVSLERVLEERLEQVFCHDSALALEITVEEFLARDSNIQFWLSSLEQCALANVLWRFATASAISGDHQTLAGRLMLPKGMAEAAASLRSLIKVWMASERESIVKLERGGQWLSI